MPGSELVETKRNKLGKLLGRFTRHLLLMAAMPHNGKEEDLTIPAIARRRSL
jgi:hypothetical protein